MMETNIFQKLMFDADFDELNNMIRWNGANRIKDETVAHHSFLVALYTRIICEEMNLTESLKLQATTYAIFHDFDEMFTGDINHNVKYNDLNGKEIREGIKDFIQSRTELKFQEENATNQLFKKSMGESDEFVKSLVKIADWLSMCFYLKKEISLGNKSMYNKLDYCILGTKNAVNNLIGVGTKNSIPFSDKILIDIMLIKWQN